jgi:hypothetical protein
MDPEELVTAMEKDRAIEEAALYLGKKVIVLFWRFWPLVSDWGGFFFKLKVALALSVWSLFSI